MTVDAKRSFVLYFDYRQHLAYLTDEERGKLLMALLEYGENGTEPELEGAALMAFSFIRSQMDRDAQKYAETCKKRSEAGKRGGRPANQNEEHEKESKAKKANAFSEKQSKAKKADNDTDNDNENDTDNDNENDTDIEEKKLSLQELRFAEFWAEYPKKKAKKDAQKAWNKIKPTAELFENIMEAVKFAKNSMEWKKENGRFIPNPATWLNGGRWDDELTPSPIIPQQTTGNGGKPDTRAVLARIIAEEEGGGTL